ncbi:hypothetical protein H0I31_06290 [Tenacibaculum sp. AHE15PA]|uniref:hypothetical protein n=1 Tax=unclassified Tenacibaculum TaxID=2635139 RepID=UPI001C4F261A|nr:MULTISPECIES: hypothetical protein [unclassified Tenacibaculum]QXP73302.1 hypothetical protein H0I30_11550 [Tenacibaculum sp. AHE14PA]QXP77215.1 hypothetical protein H0I31_06290 [Tenacibaculum sp. AHE15PA]
MRILIAICITAILTLSSCKQNIKKDITEIKPAIATNNIQFKNKAHQLVYQTVEKTGNYSELSSKKDVIYTYTYKTPDGKTDTSTEKYIFNNELSYGLYTKHERTLTHLSGNIEQGYDGKEFWLKNNGRIILDSVALKRVAFNRPTNFYWFTMIQKLLDPGVNYEYIKEENIGNNEYDIVKITFNSKDNKPKDVYQLYINKNTKLIDQFLFTVVDFGKTDPFLMKLQYENIEGLLIPTKRKYKNSNWNAEVTNKPWIFVNWTNIKFNNGIKIAEFKK